MTYWIIFEGHNKSGKSTILFSILDWLKKNNVQCKYANDQSYQKECMVSEDSIDLDKLYQKRNYSYQLLEAQSNVILMEESFLSTWCIYLSNLNGKPLDYYIERELELLCHGSNKVTIFTLVRDYSNPLLNQYIDNTHTLLTQYHLDTKVWSNTDITPATVIENVKDDIAMELFE